MTDNRFERLLEQLAGQILQVNGDSTAEIEELVRLLGEFQESAASRGKRDLAKEARICRQSLLSALEKSSPQAIAEVLESISKSIAMMQSGLVSSRAGVSEISSNLEQEAADEIIQLPDWVEEKTFLDFISAQQYAVDDIESNILELEAGLPENFLALRRRVHTSKGEAGAIGFEEVAQVLHAMEDLLEVSPFVATTARIDYLLLLKDWFASTIERLRERKGPRESAEHVLKRANAILSSSVNRSVEPGLGKRTNRDSTAKRLLAEFINDAGEDLNRIDQLLVNIEQGDSDAETIHSLFRIFHTHKGIAGFLGLNDIVDLTHATEHLLNLGREGRIEFHGEYLEIIFLATDWFRRLLDVVRQCLENGHEVARITDLIPFLGRIDVVTKSAQNRQAVGSENSLRGKAAPTSTLETAPAATAVIRADHQPQQVSAIRETVRVDLAQVDSLVELIGELMIIESMVLNSPEVSSIPSLRFRGHVNQLMKISRDLQRRGMQLRMVPVRNVFQKMSRLVRDLARKSGKNIRLNILGEGTEMDRSMVELLADPLIHLVRNSVDHGIETPEERLRQGKAAQGEIHLEARHEGGSIAIEIRDDGRGLNRAAIHEKAVQKGLMKASEQLTEADIQRLLFLPGFSTAKRLSEISGRGVGLDVVKKNIESMHGRIIVSSTVGHGTAFKLVLPLTLAIIDGMLVGCGAEKYIIPTLSIVESIKPTHDMLKTIAGRRELINIRGEIFALFRLGDFFKIANAQRDPTEGIVIILDSFGKRVALLVDEVITQQQVVIKGSSDQLNTRDYFSGATILADGRVGLILNAHEICNHGGEKQR
jgi:two-component system, chemotaxis family, sensor kinase CheA